MWGTASPRAIHSVTSNPPRRLLRPAEPVAGESLRGMIADACARNRIPNTWGMLQHFGLLHRNRVDVSESEVVDTDALAAALGVDQDEVRLRRYPSVGRSHRLFYGLEVNASRLENRVRRFSPAAIGAGVLHHPATHELRDLPFSTVGWDLLQDSCVCETDGVRQGWTRVNGTARCDCCGARLDRLQPILVPQALKDSLTVVADLVSPDHDCASFARLPERLQNTSRTAIFDVITALGRSIAPAAPWPLGQLKYTEGLARASEAILNWPHGIDRLEPGEGGDAQFQKARRAYLLLDACSAISDEEAIGRMHSAPAKYLPAGACGIVQTCLQSAMAAARASGIDEVALKQAWDEGRVTQHRLARGGLRVRGFDLDEVLALAPKLRLEKARSRTATLLGLPVHGLEQLIADRLYEPASPKPGFNQWAAHEEETTQLIGRLSNVAQAQEGEGITLLEASRYVSGRAKPWAAIMRSLIEGDISFALKAANKRPLTQAIFVSPDDVWRMADMHFDASRYPNARFSIRWSQADALEYLNGYKNAAELLHGLRSSGTTPRWYLASEVEARGQIGVTTSDLARRSRLSIIQTYRLLQRADVPQVVPSLWSRTAAEELLIGRSTLAA